MYPKWFYGMIELVDVEPNHRPLAKRLCPRLDAVAQHVGYRIASVERMEEQVQLVVCAIGQPTT